MKLYPHQTKAVALVRQQWLAYQHLLGVAPTGSGKTVMFLAAILGAEDIPPILHADQRVLILLHRTELIEQTIQRIHEHWPQAIASVGVVQAAQNDVAAQIICASVGTIKQQQRLAAILAHGPIHYLIVDEAHHAFAPTYRTIIATLRDHFPQMRHLGVTATPYRQEGGSLGAIYQAIAFSIDIRDLIAQGYLTTPHWLGVQTDITIKDLPLADDAHTPARALAKRFEIDQMLDVVTHVHNDYAADRKTIVFTSTVRGAQALSERFQQRGFPAAWVSGTHPDRASIVEQFRTGMIRVVVNAQVLVEGFDQPDVDCIHMFAPTRSRTRYMQCIGRALRPGKPSALIIDYMPIERDLTSLPDIIPPVQRHTVSAAIYQANGSAPYAADPIQWQGGAITYRVHPIDYLGPPPRGWSADKIDALGRYPDRVLAEWWGVSQTTIRRKRMAHGIPPAHKPRFVWTPEADQHLGRMPDERLAEQLGVTKETVTMRREHQGIPSYETQVRTMLSTPPILGALGTMHDSVLANQLGIPVELVREERIARNIPPFGKHPGSIQWTPERESMLGTVPDSVLAQKWGVRTAIVAERRTQLGIPMYEPPGPEDDHQA